MSLLVQLWGGNLTVQFEMAFISLQRLQRIGPCGSARDAGGQELPLRAAKRNHFWEAKRAIGTQKLTRPQSSKM